MIRRAYDREFKLQAVRLSEEEGRTVKSVARELGIDPQRLYDWRWRWKAAGERAFPGKGMWQSGQKPYEDSPTNAKMYHLGIRMNAQESQRLGDLAACVGMTKSQVVRAALKAFHWDPALLTPMDVDESPLGREETP